MKRMIEDEWGPWIEHDGKGCPCVGAFVQSEERCGLVECHIAGSRNPHNRHTFSAWKWPTCPPERCIIRYRIRKPRGLTILHGLLENLPEQVDA